METRNAGKEKPHHQMENRVIPSEVEGPRGATTDSASLPNSRKIYVSDLRVPFREISLAPTKTISGQIEVNEPVRVYDTSGPWGDETVALNVEQGLPALRRDRILQRGDVEEIEGRAVKPVDDGYLSTAHAAHAEGKRPTDASPARTVQRPIS